MPLSRDLLEKCLTTLYRMVTSNPEAVTKDVADVLATLVPLAPKKCLIIIKLYIDKIDSLENPWDVVSVLNRQLSCFITSEVAVQYVSLIYFLLSTIDDLRDSQLDFYVSEFVDCLSSKKVKDETLIEIYKAISLLADTIELDDDTTASHLSKPSLQEAVCHLLLTCNVNLEQKTINKLSNIKTNSAAYILLKFALSKNDHSNLVKFPSWLEENQISPALKMRLFLAVLLDKKCRSNLAVLPQTANYLSFLIDTKNGEVFKMLSTCVRRLISKNSLKNFQSVNFYSKFWEAVLETKNDEVIGAGVMCVDKLVKSGYLDDLKIILPTMKDVINMGGGAAEQAIKIVAECSQFSECAPVLKKNGYPRYFAKLRETKSFVKECDMFEKNIA